MPSPPDPLPAPCRFVVDGMRLEGRIPALTASAFEGAPDWSVQIVRGPPTWPEHVTWTGEVRADDRAWARFGRTPEGLRLIHLEGLGVLEVGRTGEATLRHERGQDADADVLRHALPYLVPVGGGLALHAAAAVIDGHARLLCAASGVGKSTLALALDRAGVPVLGDDHVAVGRAPEGFVAWPSGDALAAWPASRRAFDADDGTPGKRSLLLRTKRPDRAPVGTLAFLRRGPRVAVHPVPVAEALRRLLADVLFQTDPADDEETRRRLDLAADLVEGTAPFELEVPDGLDRLAAALPEIIATLA